VQPASTLREDVINSVLSETEPENDYSSEGPRGKWYCVQYKWNLRVTNKLENCKVTSEQLYLEVLF